MMITQNRIHRPKGFGLIELLVVLIIIAILFSLNANSKKDQSKKNPLANYQTHVEQQIAMKKNLENQISQIQKTAEKKYSQH